MMACSDQQSQPSDAIQGETFSLIGFTQNKIALGADHTCMIEDDSGVVCWGSDEYQQLGDPAQSSGFIYNYGRNVLDESSNPLTGVVSLSAGNFHTCALMESGEVKCWGRGNNGQLGNGKTDQSGAAVNVVADENESVLSGIVSISSGKNHNCALTEDRTVKCWGKASSLQLGNGSSDNSSIPVDVHKGEQGAPLDGIIGITSGARHNCALHFKKNVYCWGEGKYGQLGHSDEVAENEKVGFPVLVKAGGIVQIAASAATTCGLTESHGVKCWGGNDHGQLGNGESDEASYFPVDVVSSDTESASLSDIVQISGRGNTYCALRAEGFVQCWGRGASGNLGNGTETAVQRTPVYSLIDGASNTKMGQVTRVFVGNDHSCAVQSDTLVRCWGSNDNSRLGSGIPGAAIFSIPPVIKQATEEDGAVSVLGVLKLSSYQHSYHCLQDRCLRDSISLGWSSTSSSPSSTNMSPTLEVIGLAEDQTLMLYNTPDCSSPLVGSVSSDSPSITITPELTTGWHAFYYSTSTTPFLGCSQNPIYYYYSDQAIARPTISLENSAGDGTSVVFTVSDVAPGSLIRIRNGDCSNVVGSAIVDIYADSSLTTSALSISGTDGDYSLHALVVSDLYGRGPSHCSSAVTYTLSTTIN